MTVVFYISGHGFGHASRQVEVINTLAARRPDTQIIIRTAVSPDLLARTLRVPYTLRAGACDTGIVQSSSVTHDDEATVRQASDFYRTLAARAEAEAAELSNDAVRLVVADIPPLAFEVAARLRVPAVGIANFTWDWIYETHPGFEKVPGLLRAIRQAYAKATLALELPFSGGFEVFPTVRKIPLIARRPTRTRLDTRAHFHVPGDRPAALLSFGGYGLPSLDLSSVDCLDEWTVVTTDRITAPGGLRPAHVVFIAEEQFLTNGFRYEDLVAASDVVVTKPGYGIIAECIASGTPMLYTSRGRFREYDLLVREMPTYLRSRFISQADLFAGRWRAALETLRAQPPPPQALAADGADIAAGLISSVSTS